MEENKAQSQTERNKRWQEKNKERSKYLTRRSTSRGFIRKDATEEDLQELEGLIAERREVLNRGEQDE